MKLKTIDLGINGLEQELAAHCAVKSFTETVVSSLEGKSLTAKEAEVLELLAKGMVSMEIAEKLSVSFFTVRSRMRRIYMKLNLPKGKKDDHLKKKLTKFHSLPVAPQAVSMRSFDEAMAYTFQNFDNALRKLAQ